MRWAAVGGCGVEGVGKRVVASGLAGGGKPLRDAGYYYCYLPKKQAAGAGSEQVACFRAMEASLDLLAVWPSVYGGGPGYGEILGGVLVCVREHGQEFSSTWSRQRASRSVGVVFSVSALCCAALLCCSARSVRSTITTTRTRHGVGKDVKFGRSRQA